MLYSLYENILRSEIQILTRTINMYVLSDPQGNTFQVQQRNIRKHFKIKDLNIKMHYYYTHVIENPEKNILHGPKGQQKYILKAKIRQQQTLLEYTCCLSPSKTHFICTEGKLEKKSEIKNQEIQLV